MVPVWIAVAAWFVGATLRCIDSPASRRWFGWSWLLGSVVMWVHIYGSYSEVYEWSHELALLETANESERVTGIRASWGVYVNFGFAMMWSVYSIRVVLKGLFNSWIDHFVFWFTAVIVLMATVVFEEGVVRYASFAGFAAIGFLATPAVRSRLSRWGGDR